MPFEKGNKLSVGKGRPRKADKYARPIAAAEKRISEWMPELIDKMRELSQAGDRAATEYLINRIMGKPTERREFQGDVDSFIMDLSRRDDSSTTPE